jgi:hypothetical protein
VYQSTHLITKKLLYDFALKFLASLSESLLVFVCKIMNQYKHLPIDASYISLKYEPKFALGGAFRYMLPSSSSRVRFYGSHRLNLTFCQKGCGKCEWKRSCEVFVLPKCYKVTNLVRKYTMKFLGK